MIVVADESVDAGIIVRLRHEGVDVIAISEGYSGIKDEEVLRIAVKNGCLLITEDKDFGELTYRLKQKHHGIILIRISDIPRNERIDLVTDIICRNIEKLSGHFSVLTKRGLRIKHARIT